MLNLRTAAALLARTTSVESSRALLTTLGFTNPLPISESLRARLELDARTAEAELVTGPGALRAFSFEADAHVDLADLAGAVSRRLQARAPHVLWLVLGVQRMPEMVLLAVPRPAPRPGIAALVVDRGRVVDSDAETFASLAAVTPHSAPDLMVHARWAELLGREALNRRFYRVLEQAVRGLAAEARGGRAAADRDEVALLCSSRLLFLAFLQSKGWLDGDRQFLARTFDRCMASGGGAHRRSLRPLFFGTLNTPWARRAPAARAFGAIPFLNGGLFAPTAAERGARAPVLSDATLGSFLHDVLGRYRFTAREDGTTLAEAAVDPEMLGRAFESLMASRERRASGTFYTPSGFAARLVDGALLGALEQRLPPTARDVPRLLAEGTPPPESAGQLVQRALRTITLLDPACGSGALLVHALGRLSSWCTLAGDLRSPDAIRRDLLARCIFGIDRDPTAVWLCELRLWLAIAVECDESDPRRVLPLPNLDRNIRVGDALLAPLESCRTSAQPGSMASDGSRRLTDLRLRYARATGARKLTAARTLDRAERAIALAGIEQGLVGVAARRRDILGVRRGRDLFGARGDTAALAAESAALRQQAASLRRERRRLLGGGGIPFRYDTHFADVFADGGFAAIVGNPPWVRLHRVAPHEREVLRARYTVLRDATWAAGATAAGAGAGFAGQADLAALFVERSLALLRPRGVLSLLLPAKLWTTLAGGGVRKLLHDSAVVRVLEDRSEAPDLFDAVTYPSVLVAERVDRGDAAASAETELAVHRGPRVASWCGAPGSVAFDASPGSPWLLLPPAVRRAFDRLRRDAVPLGDTPLGRPVMGVKCGFNDAFLVRMQGETTERRVSVVDRAGRTGIVDGRLLRPVLRGERVRAWHATGDVEHIVWTHDATGPLRALPASVEAWLAPHRTRLASRSDTRGRRPWWSLHRVEGAQSRHARVVWPDLVRAPRALWLLPGDPTVPLNTCYVLTCETVDDAAAIAALLNSCVAGAWLRSIAEPARGGYRRLFAWTTALLPIPGEWQRAREILAPLGRRGADGGAPTVADLLDATLDAYRIRRADVEPLLEWQQTGPA